MFVEQQDRKGNTTLRVKVENVGLQKELYISGRYDAKKEGRDFAEYHRDRLKRNNILYGLGLGYHVTPLLADLEGRSLYVFENRVDICTFAREKGFYRELEGRKDVRLIVSADEREILQKMQDLLRREEMYFFAYPPLVDAIHEKNSPDLKYILESLKFISSNSENSMRQMQENQDKNRGLKDRGAEFFFGRFEGRTALLVSAGPGLRDALPHLKELSESCLIVAVGRAVKALLAEGIFPDFVTVIDPSDLVDEQFRGCEKLSCPLLYLSTASHIAVRNYRGPRYIFYNDPKLVSDSDFLIPTKGSVATAAFSLILRFGCSRLVFVGQDLAYVDGQNYLESLYYDLQERSSYYRSSRKVLDVSGNYIDTTLEYLSYKRWFEEQIRNHPQIEFYNASKGAHIEGTKVIECSDLIRRKAGDGICM
ncbi:MAG: DUF115 domain-containing protein [Peptostreptococcaceae bacterium]|nr:DUF115 domain-containing protein [Peptostreptococcaceae bacterium]